MATYKFYLKNYGGCYIGVSASTLKDACNIYQLIVRGVHLEDNSVVDTVLRIRKEVLFGNDPDKN